MHLVYNHESRFAAVLRITCSMNVLSSYGDLLQISLFSINTKSIRKVRRIEATNTKTELCSINLLRHLYAKQGRTCILITGINKSVKNSPLSEN